MEWYELIGIGFLIGLITVWLFVLLFLRPYKKPKSGTAIIRSGMGGIRVAYNEGIFVLPMLHEYDELDLSNKQLEYPFINEDALLSKKFEKVEITINANVRINIATDDMVRVYQTIGVNKSNDIDYMKNYFAPRIREAAAGVASQYNYEDLIIERAHFKNGILNYIGRDFDGYVIDDLFIEKINKLS